MRRPKLLLAFGLLALIPVVALGLALSISLEHIIRDRALEDARTTSSFVTAIGIPAYVPETEIREGLPRKRLSLLDGVLKSGVIGESLAGLTIRNAEGRIVFSDRRRQIGRRLGDDHAFRAAMAGTVQSSTASLHGQKVFEVSAPLQYPGHLGGPAGVVTVYLPYSMIMSDIAGDTRRLYLILAAGLGLLYLLLFPVVARATTGIRRHAAAHEHLAHHDALTGLPNRVAFTQRAVEALSGDGTAALMVLDLDQFKIVNDSLGHLAGDDVLREAAKRLGAAVRSSDTVARLGGDEFGVLLPETSLDAAEKVAQRLLEALEDPVSTSRNVTARVRGSVGVARAPEHGRDFDTLLQAADFAMYAAKQSNAGYRVAADPSQAETLPAVPVLRSA